MSVRLAFGVSAGPGLRCWLPTSGGAPMPADDQTVPSGSPVAVGPAGAAPATVRTALDQLVSLVAAGTAVAAGAGVDLGGGFTSARLAGAPGDRRDAVLAAVRSVGTDRLGDRNAVLVALFGLSATKRVGAAANAAIVEERWAALQLASAVSDLLGPEQLERVLELSAPDGIDLFPRGAASTLADHLARVLTRYPRPRRLMLVLSLWDHVCTRLIDRQLLARLASSQVRADRVDRLRERHREHFDAPLLQQMTWALGDNPTTAAAARWRPPRWWTVHELNRLLHDAIAATALLRFARTMSGEGIAVAAEKHHHELVAADARLTEVERSAASHRREGAYSHPARPGRYVHDLLRSLRQERATTRKTEAYVRERVAMARNYGVVVLDAVTELVEGLYDLPLYECVDGCTPWQAPGLREWRAAVGFRRAPDSWEQPTLTDACADVPKQTLAQRIAAAPEADPVVVEVPHDLLWYADLADALAPVHGHEAAAVRHGPFTPALNYDPPGRPRATSVPLIAAEVAQLVAFGATPPPRCGSWPALVEAVRADAAVAEATVGTFPIPAELSAVDALPGTELSVELGRDPRQLAEWSGYMGNCIGQPWYAEAAGRGQCVLMALRDRDDRIVANLELRRSTGGWQVGEFRARFNDAVDPALAEAVTRWVADLAPPPPPALEPVVPEPPVRSRTPRRSAAGRLPAELTRALAAEVTRTLATAPVVAARRTYAALAGELGDLEPAAAVIALKRLGAAQHVELLRAALAGGLGASALWRATQVRPLATAVSRLDPGLRDRLTTLAGGGPLPRTLRALVRKPEIAPAYAMDVVARAERTAMGKLLDDDVFTRSVSRRPTPELVCALVIATTCATSTVDNRVQLTPPGTTAVPGFPTTDVLDDHGPWQEALPASADLGAEVESFPRHVAEHGLLAPARLLGRGGWPPLWHRSHR